MLTISLRVGRSGLVLYNELGHPEHEFVFSVAGVLGLLRSI